MKIGVLPDSHAHPDFGNERFTWAGKLFHDLKVDVIVNIGDIFDFPSLCFHSKPIEIENARYQKDIEVGVEAQDRIVHELKKHKKKMPRTVITLGNHDIRPDRYVAENPVFEGKISIKDCQFDKYHDDVVPFLEPIEIGGVDFCHYYTSGLMGRPIGGQHPSWTVIKKRNKSSVCGHSHVTDYKIDLTPGRSLMGLVCGSYVDYDAAYAGIANRMWNRGIAVLDDVEDGLYDFSWISLEKIRKVYGKR
jgi:hypothetical protein